MKPDEFLNIFFAFTVSVMLQVLSLSHVCTVPIMKLYWRLSSLTLGDANHVDLAFVVPSLNSSV